MKNAVQKLLCGWEGSLFQSGVTRMGSLALCAAFCLALLTPLSASAHSRNDDSRNRPTTELKYLQTLVQICGNSDKFGPDSTPADYVRWARNNGLNPNGGWKPNNPLTAQLVAQTLVQLIDLNPRKFNGNYFKILEREGIIIPRGGKITNAWLARVFSDEELRDTVFKHCHDNSPTKPPGHGGGGKGGGGKGGGGKGGGKKGPGGFQQP